MSKNRKRKIYFGEVEGRLIKRGWIFEKVDEGWKGEILDRVGNVLREVGFFDKKIDVIRKLAPVVLERGEYINF